MAPKTKVLIKYGLVFGLYSLLCFASYAVWREAYIWLIIAIACVPWLLLKLFHIPDFSQRLNSIKSYRRAYNICGIATIGLAVIGISSADSSIISGFCFIAILILFLLFCVYRAYCEYKLASSIGQEQ